MAGSVDPIQRLLDRLVAKGVLNAVDRDYVTLKITEMPEEGVYEPGVYEPGVYELEDGSDLLALE